jgi:hypothetical protein
VDQDQGQDGAGVPGAAGAREGRGAAHGLPGGRVPQYLRVLGGPRGDVPHRRLAVHAPLRLLPDRHRQAGRLRHRRAASRRGQRPPDAAALRHRDVRRPRRPARRRGVAQRRDDPSDPRRQPGNGRRTARHRLQWRARAAQRGVRCAARGLRPQRRDGPAYLQAHPTRVPVRALPRRADAGAERRAHHEVEPDPRDGRRARGGRARTAGSA